MKTSLRYLFSIIVLVSIAGMLGADAPSPDQHEIAFPTVLPVGYYTDAAAPQSFFDADRTLLFAFAFT